MSTNPAFPRTEAAGMGSAQSQIETGAPLEEMSDFARALICSRQNVSPKRLLEPGPSPSQIEELFHAAAAAPDHGMLRPWRFVIVPQDKRASLGEAFAAALLDRDAAATPDEMSAAREKAHRAPFLMLAIVRLGPDDSGIPDMERVVSLGCAIQNILLTAHAMNLGAGLTSGQAMGSPRMRTLFGLSECEQPVCCINIGTVEKWRRQRDRPMPAEFSSTL